MTIISKYGALSTATRAAEEVLKERKRAAEDALNSIALGLYNNLVDTAVANSLPPGYMPEELHLGITIPEVGSYRLPLGELVRMPDNCTPGISSNYFTIPKYLIADALKAKDAMEALEYVKEELREMVSNMTANIKAYKSWEKLQKEWPEMAKYIPEGTIPPKPQPLVVSRENLNRKYGLPVSK